MAPAKQNRRTGKAKKKLSKTKKLIVPRVHWKSPGFAAFCSEKGPKNRKWVKYDETESPEHGIHSGEWANAIVRQEKARILNIPFELRKKIWLLIIDGFSFGDRPIKPQKNKMKFMSYNWPDAAVESAMLPLICRQAYVDVMGGGLLYKHKQFAFTPSLLPNYVWVINPAHKDMLRNISLLQGANGIPSRAYKTLSELKGLKNLTIDVYIDESSCQLNAAYTYRDQSHHWPASRVMTYSTAAYFLLRDEHRSKITITMRDSDGSGNLYNGRAVPHTLLRKLSECEALKSIKNLETFELNFTTAGYRSIDHTYGKILLNDVNKKPLTANDHRKGPYGELEDHIKLHVLSPRALAEHENLKQVTTAANITGRVTVGEVAAASESAVASE